MRIGGLSLVGLALIGRDRSVHSTLFGSGEWGPSAQFVAWGGEEENSLVGTLFGGALRLGEEPEIDWE